MPQTEEEQGHPPLAGECFVMPHDSALYGNKSFFFRPSYFFFSCISVLCCLCFVDCNNKSVLLTTRNVFWALLKPQTKE